MLRNPSSAIVEPATCSVCGKWKQCIVATFDGGERPVAACGACLAYAYHKELEANAAAKGAFA